jgi:hypothetical protein
VTDLSQPLLSVGDSNWYTLTPGESVDAFGGGWTLSGGAQIQTTRLADGQTSQVLNLPSGSKAVSPVMCVDDGYQTARSEVRNVVGSQGVFFYVSYEGTNTWNNPQKHRAGPRTADQLDALRPGQRPAQQHPRLAARTVHVRARGHKERFPDLRLLR